MATIPMGNFGQAVARPGPMVNIPQGDPIGRAAQRTEDIAGNIAGDMVAQEAKLAKERQIAQASLALAKTNNEMHAAHDEVAKGVLEGTIATDKAAGELQSRIGKIRDTNLNGYGEDQRPTMEAHLEATSGNLTRSLGGVVMKRQQSETASTIDQFGEQVSREAARVGPKWAADKFGAMVDFTGGAAGLNDAQIAKLKQQFGEKVHATFYELAGTAALTKADAPALGSLVEKLQGPEGDPLDPMKRAQLTNQLFGWQQHVLANQKRSANDAEEEARKRYNEAADVYNKATDISLGGGYLSPEFIKELTTKAAGTEMQKPVIDLIGSQQLVAGFASKPAAERTAIINGMRQERATPGVGTDPLGDKLLAATTAMDAKLRAAAKDNPWTGAQQAGVIQDARQFNPSNPAEAMDLMRTRMGMINKVENWAGQKISPLQPEEALALGRQIKALPSDQAMVMLSGLAKTINDPQRLDAVAEQMDKGHPAIALALKFGGDQTNAGRYIGSLILDGQQAITDKTVKADDAKLTGWKQEIASMVRGTIGNPAAESEVIEAAYLVRAGMDVKGVNRPGYDLTRSNEQAVKLLIGAPLERGGTKTLLPRGIDESAFDNKLRDFTGEKLRQIAPVFYVRGQPVQPEALSSNLLSYGMKRDGRGLYVPVKGSALVTIDAAGTQPLRLEVR